MATAYMRTHCAIAHATVSNAPAAVPPHTYHRLLKVGAGELWVGNMGTPVNAVPTFSLAVNVCDIPPINQLLVCCESIIFPKGRNGHISHRAFSRTRLLTTVTRINEVLESGKHVIVFCETGNNKSAAVIAAYITWKYKQPAASVLAYIAGGRPSIAVTEPYQKRLVKWSRSCRK